MVSRFLGMFRRKEGKDGDCEDPDCLEIRNMSSEYIDGDLDGNTSVQITEHLDKCPGCNVFVRTLKRTIEMLRGSPEAQAPSDFQDRIRARLRNER